MKIIEIQDNKIVIQTKEKVVTIYGKVVDNRCTLMETLDKTKKRRWLN